MTSFDLRRLKLRPGEQHREQLEVELPVFEFGGEQYLPVPSPVTAELVVTRAVTGTVFALRLAVRLHGPCYRCLGDAVLDIPIDAREYQAQSPDDEELTTPYVISDQLDVSAWARDLVVLALPEKILCSTHCAGLCPVCGENLNQSPHEHAEEPVAPRWEALDALRGSSE